ncbi:mutator mutT protein [Nocardioides exalbidus]|uniref:Mutator mutT protein n=1 Tax=Nocardioides exalbidus TaxID=402596 RepID=A0A1H4RIB2_9ACTN|nr:NUDIX domain-containing protein [Nocardioides exalbidus]SEC31566.1 mutator mutT protein [Nocardioides exalbidus]
MVEVVVGALVRDGQVLLVHRRPDKHAFPGTWDLPGGVVEAGESELDALERELREELGVEADTSTTSLMCRVDLGTAHLAAWLVPDWAGEPANAAPEEHDDLGWFGLDELPPLVHELVRQSVVTAMST